MLHKIIVKVVKKLLIINNIGVYSQWEKLLLLTIFFLQGVPGEIFYPEGMDHSECTPPSQWRCKWILVQEEH